MKIKNCLGRVGAGLRISLLAFITISVSLPASLQAQELTMENLLDRIYIEDFLTRYYYDLAQGQAHELSNYFTEDALLDVDGTVAVGHDEIDALYGGGGDSAEPREPGPQNHMLLSIINKCRLLMVMLSITFGIRCHRFCCATQ